MPNKVTVSFAGCSNSCSRPHNSDVGVIAIGRVAVNDSFCPDNCDECIKICKFGAIKKAGGKIRISDDCIHCTQCVGVCGDDILGIEKTGFRVLLGGKEGSSVMFGREYASFADDFEVLEIIEKCLQNYVAKAGLRPGRSRKKERLGEVIVRLGLETFMN